MRVLLLFAERVAFSPGAGGSASAETDPVSAEMTDAVLAFVHVEPKDLARLAYVETKLIKHIKWMAGKNSTRRVLLHSFAHLAQTRAAAGPAAKCLERVSERLARARYAVRSTGFGYTQNLDLRLPGRDYARVFKSI